ncbi:MAG TPA: hypothetical protein VF064_15870, partial [Pyrinomonadaceae bacterium]
MKLLNTLLAAAAALAALGLVGARTAVAQTSPPWVTGEYRGGDFKLVYGGRAADILVSPEDFKVVGIAAGDLAADVERVTGKRPVVRAPASA